MKTLHKILIVTMLVSMIGMSYMGPTAETKVAEDIPFSWVIHS